MDLRLTIAYRTYLKLKYFIDECDNEISGFGMVSRLGDHHFHIYDIEVLPQEVTSTNATINDEDLANFLYHKMKAGESTEPYKLWWHSHANMGVFWSSTDNGTINGSTDFPYLISIVGNKKGELKSRIDIYEPIRLTIDVELEIEELEDEELRAECATEIKEKVVSKSWFDFGSTKVEPEKKKNKKAEKKKKRKKNKKGLKKKKEDGSDKELLNFLDKQPV